MYWQKECNSCLQCSRAVCSDFSTDYTMDEKNFVNKVSSFVDKTFQCFHGSGMVVLDRNYSMSEFVNSLFWGSLAWFLVIAIIVVCASWSWCPRCERKSSIMRTPVRRTTTANVEENSRSRIYTISVGVPPLGLIEVPPPPPYDEALTMPRPQPLCDDVSQLPPYETLSSAELQLSTSMPA